MRRVAIRLTVILTLSASALLLAQPAWSAPPPPDVEPFTILAPGTGPNDVARVCDFDVQIDVFSEAVVRATLPNGLLVIAGKTVSTVTNLNTGESADYNISGPGTFDPTTNRLTLRGNNLILGPEGSTGGEDPFLIVTGGTLSFIQSEPIDVPLRGHIQHDVCAELA